MVDFAEMRDHYFPLVHDTIGSSPIPDDILESDYYLGLRSLVAQAEKAGFRECESTTNGMKDGYVRFRMGIDWDATREEMENKRVASQIKAEFWFGQNSGAKQTLDTNYLKQAEETGCVEIRPPSCSSIAEDNSGKYIVDLSIINTKGRKSSANNCCDHLFMAAGVSVRSCFFSTST